MEASVKARKILALTSSKRRLANGEILVKEAAKAADETAELEIINLSELKLDFCSGCYTCLIPDKKCPRQDDLYFIVEKIKAADGIIIASPCYALGPNAPFKLLADRAIALSLYVESFAAKPCITIATAGIEGWEGYTISALNSIAGFMGLDIKDSEVFIGALPGEGIMAEGAMERIKEMGQALFGKKTEVKEGECPTCRSDIWKFKKADEIVCAICGQKANLVCDETGQIIRVFKKKGSRFEKEEIIRHFHGWLREKMQEFIVRRKELAQIRNKYK